MCVNERESEFGEILLFVLMIESAEIFMLITALQTLLLIIRRRKNPMINGPGNPLPYRGPSSTPGLCSHALGSQSLNGLD